MGPVIGSDPGASRALDWIRASPAVEQAAALVIVLGVAALMLWARRRWDRTPAPVRVPSRRREAAALVAILVAAACARLAWGDAAWQPRWYFPQSTTLWAARTLERGDLWQTRAASLRNTQGIWTHESAVMFPVEVAAQALLGPRDYLPLVVGAGWGLAGITLAWLYGRTVVSPAFGLAFAALVAASPLQITWARLGGLYIGSVAHVLLVLWLGYVAGRRGSILGAAVLGLLAWSSVYHYFAARVALPLAPLALLLGLRERSHRLGRTCAALAVFGMLLGGAFVVVQWAGGGGVWPSYRGYVGSRGESGMHDLVANALGNLRLLRPALEVYFWRNRLGVMLDYWQLRTTPSAGTAGAWGIASGGLCLLPVTLLGLVGLAHATVRLRRHLIVLLLGTLGLGLPVLSHPSARRFLVFDLAWCALAAGGLVLLLDSRPLSRLSARARYSLLLGVPAAIGAWACGVLALTARPLPSNAYAQIPFGESGFGDGLTCLGCLELGRRWQRDIAAGAVVVAFDTDLDREDLTSPGGFVLYGKLAAVIAGRPNNFVHFYSALANAEIEHPRIEPLYDAQSTDVVGFLGQRIETAQPTEIVWDFPEPTRWESELASRLLAAGGRVGDPNSPDIAPLPTRRPGGLQVRTPADRRGEALATLRTFLGGTPPAGDQACIALERRAHWDAPWPPMLLADAGGTNGAPPRWAVANWHEVRVIGDPTSIRFPYEAVAVVPEPTRPAALTILGRNSALQTVVSGTATDALRATPLRPPVGRDCAVSLAGTWWVVDPITGGLAAAPQPRWPLPSGAWVGIAPIDDNHLVLASADQRLQVLNVHTGVVDSVLSSRVPPSRRWHFGECVAMAASADWIATLDHHRGLLTFAGTNGEPASTLRLGDIQLGPVVYARAVHASAQQLGLAWNMHVTTFAVSRRAACTPDPP